MCGVRSAVKHIEGIGNFGIRPEPERKSVTKQVAIKDANFIVEYVSHNEPGISSVLAVARLLYLSYSTTERWNASIREWRQTGCKIKMG